MTQEKPPAKNRRRHERCRVRLNAQVEIIFVDKYIGMVMHGVQNIMSLAETGNISIGGMALHIVGSSMDADRSVTKKNAHQIVGKPIEVVLSAEDLTLRGEVLRVDPNTLEIFVVINKVSNVQRWKELCAQSDTGISIFPDTLEVRRKRRS